MSFIKNNRLHFTDTKSCPLSNETTPDPEMYHPHNIRRSKVSTLSTTHLPTEQPFATFDPLRAIFAGNLKKNRFILIEL